MEQLRQVEKQRVMKSVNLREQLSTSPFLSKGRHYGRFRRFLAIGALGLVWIPSVLAQQIRSQHLEGVTVRGVVRNLDGRPVGSAVVRLEQKGVPGALQRTSDGAGDFSFSGLLKGTYQLSAEKSGLRSRTATVDTLSGTDKEEVNLILEDSGSVPSDSNASLQGMAFADKPNFTIAGVTDWTAVGGHGSDASLRTSEDLANKTLSLKSTEPKASVASVGGETVEATRHRLAGEVDERSGDSLAAVHEYEQAVRLDPSEQNYFEWGTELLLHRAVWQAQEVFQKGSQIHPQSARMLTGLGASFFSGARYDEAALSLCHASDLNPMDTEPYLFLGKIQIAAPQPLPCVEKKLARFVEDEPANALANYFYAMAILKRQQQHLEERATQQAERLLTKAITIDPKCGEAYLQLGILSASQHDFKKATDFYTKAIRASPQLGEAHYRLGVAYDRVGESEKAKQEFKIHDEIEKQRAEAIERQRRELKQFLIVLPEQPTHTPSH